MSNDLIARLRHQSDDHNALGMGIFREAADALTAQAREIEALRADAERYRWLRDDADAGDHTIALMRLKGEVVWCGVCDYDQAIDAALASGKVVTP